MKRITAPQFESTDQHKRSRTIARVLLGDADGIRTHDHATQAYTQNYTNTRCWHQQFTDGRLVVVSAELMRATRGDLPEGIDRGAAIPLSPSKG